MDHVILGFKQTAEEVLQEKLSALFEAEFTKRFQTAFHDRMTLFETSLNLLRTQISNLEGKMEKKFCDLSEHQEVRGMKIMTSLSKDLEAVQELMASMESFQKKFATMTTALLTTCNESLDDEVPGTETYLRNGEVDELLQNEVESPSRSNTFNDAHIASEICHNDGENELMQDDLEIRSAGIVLELGFPENMDEVQIELPRSHQSHIPADPLHLSEQDTEQNNRHVGNEVMGEDSFNHVPTNLSETSQVSNDSPTSERSARRKRSHRVETGTKNTSQLDVDMEDDEVSESDTVNDDPEVNPNLLTRQTSKLKSPFISRHVTSRTNLDIKDQTSTTFDCVICTTKFSQKCNLVRHLRNVHKATIFPCRLCPRKFSKKEELEQHLELFHPKDYFPCVKCPSNFGSHDELDAHVRFTHPPQLYKCAICGRTFLTKQGMCDHDDSHKKQNSAP
ncbi:Zinc finger protein Xfin [Folsomia candida]|uniref:Zinc finger protein Xfin n=1 Tax=Folsomia candida TaxID=158441 RepID=A0A226D494_FOLCA|nr:Zinc finger protein Xfin [Folsomia candida]